LRFSAHLTRCFSVFQPPNKTVILSEAPRRFVA
jgi:hypothetical protein